MDYTTVMSYGEFAEIQDEMERRKNKRREKDRQNRTTYFIRQRAMGATIMTIGMVFLSVGCHIDEQIMEIFGAIVGIAGLGIVVTKKMVLVDSYFLECQDRMNRN